MESVFEKAIFAGQGAQVSLSSARFLVQTQNDRREVPIEKIIAVRYDTSKQLSSDGDPIPIQVFILKDSQSLDLHHFETLSFSCQSFSPFPLLKSDFLISSPELLSQNTLKIHVVVSTQSGTQKALGFFQNALQPLLAALSVPESAYRVTETTSADTVSELAQSTFIPDANRGIKQLVILLSGDGGISDIVHTLLSVGLSLDAVRPVVALIPMGTGNALFNSSCRPRPADYPEGNLHSLPDATLGLRTLLLGDPQPIPTLTTTITPQGTLLPSHTPVSTLHGCVLTSWCLHASLVALSDTPAYRTMGLARFGKAAESLLHAEDGKKMHLYQAKISVLPDEVAEKKTEHGNGEPEEDAPWLPLHQALPTATDEPDDKYTYLLATLVSHLEPTFTISPSSQAPSPTNPGALYLVCIPAAPADQVLRLMGLAYQAGKHVAEKGMGYMKIQGLRIADLEAAAKLDRGNLQDSGDADDSLFRSICVDGKIVQVPWGGTVQVTMGQRSVVDVLVLGDGKSADNA